MLVLTDIQQVGIAIAPKSAAGNPASIDGSPVWNSSDETVVTVVVAADGMSADVITTGKLGTVQVNVSADADMGGGVKSIAGTLDIEVKASEAVILEINAGTPTDK